MIQEGREAVQQRHCTLVAKYQASQSTESEHTDTWRTDTESAVPNRDKPGAPGMMEAHIFAIKASANQLRCPVCDNWHAYTGNNGLIKLSTRLINCEIGYRSKTEEE